MTAVRQEVILAGVNAPVKVIAGWLAGWRMSIDHDLPAEHGRRGSN